MRVLLVVLLLSLGALAGCSGSPKSDVPSSASDFSDINVKPTATKGVLLGVVVDEAIRPIKDVNVALAKPDGGNASVKTDVQGRFAFGDLEPGTYFIRATHPQFAPVQSSAEVVAGVAEPPVVRILMNRLFSQAAYTEQIKYDGYLACAYAFGLSSTCINDYTRVIGSTVPGCEGGCLRDYNVSKTAGNEREFRTNIGAGWQVILFEMHWEPSLGAPASMGTLGQTISFFTRPDSGHWFAQGDGASPQRLEVDLGVAGPNQQEDPALIPPEGIQDLFVFFSAGTDDVAINQRFQYFQTTFYYGIPPEGWSFVNGDQLPF